MKNDIPEIKSDINTLARRTLSLFLQGLLYIGPVFIILSLIYKFFLMVDGLLPFKIPGIGFIVIFFGVTIIGYLGNTIIAKPLFKYFKRAIDRMPLIKTIYDSVTDLLSAFVGNKKKFNVPVMVKMNMEAEIYKLGFLTKEDLSKLGIEKGMATVYLPHSYAFSGNMFVVPVENIKLLNLPSSEVMKFIVSGGVIDFDDVKTEIETDNKN